ncbi:MAG: GTP cyclohydrolase FolE2 [Pseudomonas sp.]
MNAFTLPDIAAQAAPQRLPLAWVGMQGVALPLWIDGQRLSAKADLGVSLDDPTARGIHMSRLFLALETLEHEPLSPRLLQLITQTFLDSHQGLSREASLRLNTALLMKRSALVSELSGWRSYPVEIVARQTPQGFEMELGFELSYSSTCPCSAALARQLIQQRFRADFADAALNAEQVCVWLGATSGIVATPHSQRSSAYLRVRLAPESSALPLANLIARCEDALGTAVQTAVKRADEQAFALANGQNLMFCEDAARRLHEALRGAPEVKALHVHVVHHESLHAHDAAAVSHWNWEAA